MSLQYHAKDISFLYSRLNKLGILIINLSNGASLGARVRGSVSVFLFLSILK